MHYLSQYVNSKTYEGDEKDTPEGESPYSEEFDHEQHAPHSPGSCGGPKTFFHFPSTGRQVSYLQLQPRFRPTKSRAVKSQRVVTQTWPFGHGWVNNRLNSRHLPVHRVYDVHLRAITPRTTNLHRCSWRGCVWIRVWIRHATQAASSRVRNLGHRDASSSTPATHRAKVSRSISDAKPGDSLRAINLPAGGLVVVVVATGQMCRTAGAVVVVAIKSCSCFSASNTAPSRRDQAKSLSLLCAKSAPRSVSTLFIGIR